MSASMKKQCPNCHGWYGNLKGFKHHLRHCRRSIDTKSSEEVHRLIANPTLSIRSSSDVFAPNRSVRSVLSDEDISYNNEDYILHWAAIFLLFDQKGLKSDVEVRAKLARDQMDVLETIQKSLGGSSAKGKKKTLTEAEQLELEGTEKLVSEAKAEFVKAVQKPFNLIRQLLIGEAQTQWDKIVKEMFDRDSKRSPLPSNRWHQLWPIESEIEKKTIKKVPNFFGVFNFYLVPNYFEAPALLKLVIPLKCPKLLWGFQLLRSSGLF